MELVAGLDIDSTVKERIYAMQTRDYIGDALRICDLTIANCKKEIEK